MARHGTSTPSVSAFASGCYRSDGSTANCKGANLSHAAGAHRCRLSRRRNNRHRGSAESPGALRATRPAIHCRKSSWRQYQHCDGSRGPRARGRAHSPGDGFDEYDQCVALRQLNFNLNRDFAFVAGIMQSPLVLEVHPSIPARTVPEFIAYVKANAGKISLASYGTAPSCGSIPRWSRPTFIIRPTTSCCGMWCASSRAGRPPCQGAGDATHQGFSRSPALGAPSHLGERVIDQARRRVLDGEQVPNAEKIYSIFEPIPT
jgi:hypothetical protein